MEPPSLSKIMNFKKGDYWISLKREIFYILEVNLHEITYFPIKVLHVSSKEEAVIARNGGLGIHALRYPDKLVMKMPTDHPRVILALSNRK